MSKSFIYFITFFIVSHISFSQVTRQWVAIYDGPSNSEDIARAITIDGIGNVYVTGQSEGANTFYDFATIKYNSLGIQQWVQRYNGPVIGGDDGANAIAVDGYGNVFVTGFSTGINTKKDYLTIKYNSSGVQQWLQRYNGTGNDDDDAAAMVLDASGNVYVTGYSFGINSGKDYVTIKYNSSGVQLWVQRYNGPGNGTDQANAIALDAFGNIYVTGQSRGAGTGYDYTTIKYDSSGVQKWLQRYFVSANSLNEAYAIAVSGGNVYVTGESFGDSPYTGSDFATVKYTTSGVQQWVSRYNGPGNGDDEGNAVCVDLAGNVYVTGGATMADSTLDITTIKYNSNGVQQWIQFYIGPGHGFDIANGMSMDSFGNVYIVGESNGGPTASDIVAIKYNSAGILQWVQRYNGTANTNDYGYAIAADNSGNVYVTGASVNGNGAVWPDYTTIKYSQPIGIKPISNEIPKKFSLSQNYPNPFNPSTKIKFDVAKSSNVKIIVFNILGAEVAVPVNEQLAQGSYEVQWDAGNNSSGLYFYWLETSGFTETKKMLLIK